MTLSTGKSVFAQMQDYVYSLQDRVVASLEALDSSAPAFKRDGWTRPQGGAGRSCVFSVPHTEASAASVGQGVAPNAPLLEKAGVGVSVIHGMLPPAAIKQMRADHGSIPYDPSSTEPLPFHVAGVSLIVHPRNPSAPTVHMNVRYFEIIKPKRKVQTDDTSAAEKVESGEEDEVLAWWFGGGADLTPSYLFEEDAQHFHGTFKTACDTHGAGLYPAFKKWCDEYFYIPHRQEARGVGGIFFDDLCGESHKRLPGDADGAGVKEKRPTSAGDIFAFVKSVGDALIPSYLPLLEKRVHTPATDDMRRWQLLRRGRYVEFNLVHDRGTKFGLMTPGARIESILMSLPETARWEYMSDVGEEEGSEEKKLMDVVRTPKAWV
jgi:coproporphyrinogen III oxidase